MRLIKLFLIICLTPYLSSAQTLHLILFCDTNDAKIGEAMVHDHENFIREFSNIACYIDYDIETYDYISNDCSRTSLIELLDSFKAGNDDIVVFFYSGHGTRAENNEDDPLPQLCLGSSFDSQFVPLQYIINALNRKNPRLLISITNCCNKEDPNVSIKPLLAQQGGATSVTEVNKDAYKNLFCDYTGEAIITSSRAGQYSWCSSSIGGMFTSDALDVLYLVGNNSITPTWDDVFSNMKDKTSARTITIAQPPFTATQIPYYSLNVKLANKFNDDDTHKPDNKKPHYKPDRNPSDIQPIYEILNFLVTQDIPKSQRLELIPEIISLHFTQNAKVHTLGRNGMIVDYENVSDFLRRIVLSRRIERITVISKEGQDKISELSIHEIHK